MIVLPIVERELRVAVRQHRTWVWRLLSAGVATACFLFIYWTFGRYSSLSRVGQEVFVTLTVFGMFYCLLAGPFASVDCLARERREGTLGLLFLTDLKGYDVVLGKMAAASLSLVVGGAAALPLYAAPVLLGGISLWQLGMAGLGLLNMMFFSLAAGALASSLFDSGRGALGATLLVILLATLGWTILGETLGVRRLEAYFYISCPVYVLKFVFESKATPSWEYWLNLGGVAFVSWMLLAVTCWRTRRAWGRQPAPDQRASTWRRLLQRLRQGSPSSRWSVRRRLLVRSPVAWLEVRDRLQTRVLWGLCVGVALFWAVMHIQAPLKWPEADDLFLWPLWYQYILCLWIAVQAPRRLADDKESGALELLLCTPVSPAEVVRDMMRAMWHRFGKALLMILLLDGSLAVAYAHTHGWATRPRITLIAQLGFWATIVFSIQAYCFARVGQYQALVQKNSLRATFMLVWKLGLLPYLLLFVCLIGADTVAQKFPNLFVRREQFYISLWVGTHLLPCLAFLMVADLQLRRRFRVLASEPHPPGLFQRCMRGIKRRYL